MKDFMSIDSRPFRFLSRLWDVMVLNLLMLGCSLPVITMGASLTAAYDMSLRMIRKEENGVVKGFFRAFKGNFRQATKIWLIFLMFIAVCIGDYYAGSLITINGLDMKMVLTAASGIQVFLVLAIMPYAFALTARFENTAAGTLRNSLALMTAHIPETLAMMLMDASAALIYLYVPLGGKMLPCFIFLCIVLWFAGMVYLDSILLHSIFQKHFHSEDTENTKGAII